MVGLELAFLGVLNAITLIAASGRLLDAFIDPLAAGQIFGILVFAGFVFLRYDEKSVLARTADLRAGGGQEEVKVESVP